MKRVSSLTLFEIAARKLAETDSSLQAFMEMCAQVLVEAARQGFPRCAYTLGHAGGNAPKSGGKPPPGK